MIKIVALRQANSLAEYVARAELHKIAWLTPDSAGIADGAPKEWANCKAGTSPETTV